MATPKRPVILHNIKLDRNDPCYCGSGKKYKQCCLENPRPNARDLIDYYNHWKRGRVVNKLIEGIIQELPQDLIGHFSSVYFDNPFLDPEEVDPGESHDWRNYHTTQIVNTTKLYLYDALVSGSEDVEGFKELVFSRAEEQGLTEDQRTYMLKIANATGSFFMVEKTDPDNISSYVTNIFTEEKITIIDRGICRSASSGDIMFGRPVAYKPEKNQFVLELPGLSAVGFSDEKWIFKSFTEAFKMTKKKGEKLLLPGDIMKRLPVLPIWIITAHMWFKSHPEIKNFEGDDVRFLCASYTFDDRGEILSELKKIKGMDFDQNDEHKTTMIWLDQKNNTVLASLEIGDNLVKVYVNSHGRFKKFERAARKISGLKLRDIKEESL
jgi:hypothetical protein